MRRIFCLLLLLFSAVVLQAQSDSENVQPEMVVEDSVCVAQDTLNEVPAPQIEVPLYMRQAVMRSWRLSHPLGEKALVRRRGQQWRVSVSHLLDSVRTEVKRDFGPADDMRYLYDMRLPIINAGIVPADSTPSLAHEVMRAEQQAASAHLPVTEFDSLYRRQLCNEEQRHLARFNYASVDPHRFRYVRREFTVPTSESQTIDTKTTVQGARLVEDIDVNFGKTDLEDFGHLFTVKADRWHWKGDHSLTMQQTALTDNWYKDGDNNMSVSGEQKLTVSRFDEDSKVTFEGVLDLKLSGYYTKADTIHRMRVSDNEFTLNLKYGYQAWKKWYYSAQLYAKTPVFDFYNANSRVCKSTFLSPLEMNLAFGVDYKYTSPNKKFTYSLLLAPLSYDMKYVSDPRVDVTTYKIEAGESSLHNFGSTITTKFDWKMGENATWSSRLYYFTTYHALKVEFENTFNFKISRFFTARIYLYPRFDDALDTKLEAKEMLTIGFNYAW